MFYAVMGVIFAVLAVFFLVMGIMTLRMSDEKADANFWRKSMWSETEKAELRAKYNIGKMRVFNGWCYIVGAVYQALMAASWLFDLGRFRDVVPLLFIPMVVCMFVFYRKCKRSANAAKPAEIQENE
ncbi:MAG: hypothetical protein FWB80_13200 [Defluviitaleaceae bacterium]|nr:hypothetical protein [Defluviitaleaceae bacterium]